MNGSLESLATGVMRNAMNLSGSALGRLFGDPPTNSHGAPLDPQLHAMFKLTLPVDLTEFLDEGYRRARRVTRFGAPIVDRGGPPMDHVEDQTLEGPGGSIPVRIYQPDADKRLPGCVFYHGGGFVIGDIDTHDGLARTLAALGNCHVVSVGYRRAPEHPFPAPLEDGRTAYEWVRDHAAGLNIDPERIGVAGDSAGGTIATVVAQRRIAEGEDPPDFQLLFYPMTDSGGEYSSRNHPADNLMLTQTAVEWFAEKYLDGGALESVGDHRISPLRFDDLDQMPPSMVVTAGFDPLRDEGEAYADTLADVGVDVAKRRYDRLVHGFASLSGVVDAAARATADVVMEWSERFVHR